MVTGELMYIGCVNSLTCKICNYKTETTSGCYCIVVNDIICPVCKNIIKHKINITSTPNWDKIIRGQYRNYTKKRIIL